MQDPCFKVRTNCSVCGLPAAVTPRWQPHTEKTVAFRRDLTPSGLENLGHSRLVSNKLRKVPNSWAPSKDVQGSCSGISLGNFGELALRMRGFLQESTRELDNGTHWFPSRLVCPFILFLRCCLLRNVSNCQKDSGVSHISPPALLSARAEFWGEPAIWIFNAELYSITLAARLHCSPESSDLTLWWTEQRLRAFNISEN